MKLLYAISGAEPPAVTRHLLDLLRGLGGMFDIHLAAGNDATWLAEARDYGAECHLIGELDSSNPLAVMRGCQKLAGLIGTLEPALVHSHGPRASLMSKLAARRVRVPSVSTPNFWSTGLRAPLERLAANDSGRVICISDENRREALRRGIAAGRIATIRPGMSDTERRAHPGRGMVAEVVMVAPFDGSSHHQLLLEAFAGIDAPWRLALVGEGEHQAWMRGLASKLGIAGKVRFLSMAEDVPALLTRSSLMAWAGRGAGLPGVLVEAMRAGLPVAATDAGLAHEAVLHGDTGYLVPPNDIGGFRNALWALIVDARLRTRMGEAGRLRFEQHFSTTQMLDKTVQLYEAVWAETGVTVRLSRAAAAAR